MLNQRIEAARPVADKINEVEKSLNLTLVQMGELMSNIAKARLAPGTRFELTVGMEASEQLIEAAATAAKSYREIVQAHKHLAADRRDVGLETVSWGPHECPPMHGEAEQVEVAHLQAVSNN